MTVLFDIGNVLIRVDVATFCREVLGAHEPTPDQESAFVELRDRNDRGQVSDAVFLEKMQALSPLKRTEKEILQAWNGMLKPMPSMSEVVNTLKAEGHRLILFSNINAIHLSHILEHYPILQMFDEAQYSCELGEIKPHDLFYRDAISRFDLVPKDTLYLDDLSANVKAGLRHGFHSYQYDNQNHDAAIRWLQSMLRSL